ncbi:unnamed protein product [Owenia fusiformis]|nr:unnamed protein product [Owenia fusiformis]
MNKAALKIAREVADKTGTLMAGNLSNSCVYNPKDPETIEVTRNMFKEQIEWAVEGGADFIVAETYGMYAEAKLALDCILEYGNGLPAVITMSAHVDDTTTVDGLPLPESIKKLEDAGAAVVGINCARGPETIMPVLREIRKLCKGPIAALPVCYRTSKENPTMQSLKDPDTGKMAFPYNLDAWFNSRTQIDKFGKDCLELGIQYAGLCCGNCAHYTRSLAEVVGKTPPSSRYSPDMSQHFVFGRGKDLKYRHEYNNIKDRIGTDAEYAD